MIKVLIVEDNDMNRDMLTRRLERYGYEIEISVNGEDALKRTEEYSPDIILMDMSLPVIDGWQATRLLKEKENTKNIPIIGLSAHARDVDILRGKEAGCDAYETKPVDFPHLVESINKLTSAAG